MRTVENRGGVSVSFVLFPKVVLLAGIFSLEQK